MGDADTSDRSNEMPEPNLEKVNTALESVGMFATSFGLQPYKIVIAESKKARAKIKLSKKTLSGIPENSWLILFAIYISIGKQQVNNYIDSIAKQKQVSSSSLNEYRKILTENINTIDSEGNSWSARQALNAIEKLENAISGSGLKIKLIKDFNAAELDAAFGFTEQNFTCFAITALFHEKNKLLGFDPPKEVRLQQFYLFV